jgi:hypothetical protein
VDGSAKVHAYPLEASYTVASSSLPGRRPSSRRRFARCVTPVALRTLPAATVPQRRSFAWNRQVLAGKPLLHFVARGDTHMFATACASPGREIALRLGMVRIPPNVTARSSST